MNITLPRLPGAYRTAAGGCRATAVRQRGGCGENGREDGREDTGGWAGGC